jgi:release factor glutamine methyltransferase
VEQLVLALPLTVGDALREARAQLLTANVPEPGLEASLLLAYALVTSRARLHADPQARLSAAQAAAYLALVRRRCYREPTAYITGSKFWWDLDLSVDRNVLIPRPETEALADVAIQTVGQLELANPVVADVGTGSGALAIAIARALPSARVYALETAKGALRTAARNVALYAPGRVRLLESDLVAALPEPAQIVVANLPYIPSAEISGLAPELAYEPRTALDGGADGLGPIAVLLGQIARWSQAPNTILLECGHDQAPSIRALAQAIWPNAPIMVHHDLAGVERVVLIWPAGTGSAL